MAWQPFYVQTTGSDLNAGSTTDNSALVTSTNGDWGNAAANRFTAASGTPFSGVNVNDWASIFLDAAVTAVYIAQVTAVNAGGASIDLSTTMKYGTAPANGANGRTAKLGGAWASIAAPAGLGSGTNPVGTQINIKAGTYSHTTSNITVQLIGTNPFPLWFRGYSASPGDLDNNLTTTKPSITFTTGIPSFAGAFTFFTGLSVSGTRNGDQIDFTGGQARVDNCFFENQKSGGNNVVGFTGASGMITRSWVKTQSGSGAVGTLITGNQTVTVKGCTLIGGATAVGLAGSVLIRNIMADQLSHLVTSTTGLLVAVGNSLRGHSSGTGDGFRLTSATGIGLIADNIISTVATGINNTSGTNMCSITRHGNLFHAVTTEEAGFGDTVSIGSITGGSDPYTNAGTDYSPNVAGGARASVIPSAYPNLTTTVSYADRGGIQHQDSGSGGSRGLMTGGRL